MKKFIATMMAAAMVVSLAGCANNGTSSESTSDVSSDSAADNSSESTADESSDAASEDSTESTDNGSADASARKLGMGVSTSIASSAAGNAQVDATVAAVILDADG